MFNLAAGSSGQHLYKNSNLNMTNQIFHDVVCCFTFVLTARLSYGCIFNKKETLERGDMRDLWQMDGLYEKNQKKPKWTETCVDKTAAD